MSIDFADAIVWLWFIFLGGSIGIVLLKAAYGPAKRQIQRVIPFRSWREQKEIEDAERRGTPVGRRASSMEESGP